MKIEPAHEKAFLDVSIDGEPIGRIVVELYTELAPLATKNFITLLDKFPNTFFHRVIKRFMIQAGDIVHNTSETYPPEGLGESSVGDTFADENTVDMNVPFLLCSANYGEKDSNGSQFFITTGAQPHLSGKHSVFGKVIKGKSVVREVEKVKTNEEGIPTVPVVISASGKWEEGDEVPIFNASYNPIGGDIYEEYPDDDENIDKESSESVYKASTIIKESGTLLFKAANYKEAILKWRKCSRYVMEYIPDQDQEPEWYTKYNLMRIKLYLNLSMAYLKSGNPNKAVDFAEYLLDSDYPIETADKAKAYFRKGNALLVLRKYDDAAESFKQAQKLVPDDKAIERELTRTEQLIQEKKQKEKAKYAKFFS